jgi:hypothetical protein
MEIKNSKNISKIREIFDRVCSFPHKTKIAKGFFKKYFNFEATFGDHKTQTKVKKMAQEYVTQNSQN